MMNKANTTKNLGLDGARLLSKLSRPLLIAHPRVVFTVSLLACHTTIVVVNVVIPEAGSLCIEFDTHSITT